MRLMRLLIGFDRSAVFGSFSFTGSTLGITGFVILVAGLATLVLLRELVLESLEPRLLRCGGSIITISLARKSS